MKKGTELSVILNVIVSGRNYEISRYIIQLSGSSISKE